MMSLSSSSSTQQQQQQLSTIITPFKSTLRRIYQLKIIDTDDESSDEDNKKEITTTTTPSPLHEVYYFAKMIQRETMRRIQIINTMNYIQSVGGGWASIKNPVKAKQCARILARLASMIGDEATIRKCKVFEGMSLAWEGKTRDSAKVFEIVQQEAQKEGDIENDGRCQHGMKSLVK